MGSPNGIWTAVSGGMAQSQNLEIIANNMANANTTGFKKDTPTFKEYLTSIERPPSPAIDIPRTAFKDSDFYHFDGREHAMVNLNKVHTDHTEGQIRPTKGPFDLAIQGKGFFTVQTPNGLAFTRAGDFKVGTDGSLVTADGLKVMSLGGAALAARNAAVDQALNGEVPNVDPAQAVAARAPASVNPFVDPGVGEQAQLKPLNVRDALASGLGLTINERGDVFSGDDQIGVLALAEFADPKLLKKVASTMYENVDAANVPRVSTDSQVHQGFLESSNVNSVSEIMEMIKANRMFEQNMRAIKAYNDMSGKEANEVGKL